MYQEEEKITPLAVSLGKKPLSQLVSVDTNKKQAISSVIEDLQALSMDITNIISQSNFNKESSIGNLLLVAENKIQLLAQKITNSQSQQIGKTVVTSFLQTILESGVSNKVLVDIQDNNLLILGRPNVMGSSTKQMRHVTPFTFTKELIKNKVKQSTSESLFTELKIALYALIQDDKGAFIEADEYRSLNLEGIEAFRLSTVKSTIKKEYYLISEKTLLQLDSNTRNQITTKSYNQYQDKKHKFVDYAFNVLEREMYDDNTRVIASEILARFILTLLNLKPYTTFPDEGNTLNYEIRLYDTVEDTQNPNDKKYKILSHQQISDIILDEGIDFINKKIRIVNNEGIRVKKTVKALELIASIIEKNKLLNFLGSDKDIEELENLTKEYNTKYNFDFNEPKISSKYHDNIKIDNISYHISKHLFIVFDFLPLENKVFVPDRKGIITVYPSANGKKIAKYSIQDGDEYRAEKTNSATGYNNDALFYTEIANDTELLDITKQLVFRHLKIIFAIFPVFFLNEGKNILTSFVELLAIHHTIENSNLLSEDINRENLEEHCKNLLFPEIKQTTSDDDSSVAISASTIIGGDEVSIASFIYL